MCENCKGSSKKKVWLDGQYHHVSCKVLKKTFKKSYGNVILQGGYRICGFKSVLGFHCWIGQGDEDGNHFRHSHTKIYPTLEDAYIEAVSHLEKPKDRQLELF